MTWHDEEVNVVWVCACELRSDDTYDDVLALHARDELLPGSDDYARFGQEAALRTVRELMRSVPEWVRAAQQAPNIEQRFTMENGAQIRMIVQGDGELMELWIAMPTTEAAVAGLHPNTRVALVAIAERAFTGQFEWEVRYDWPTGPLLRWEVARLGLGTSRKG